MQLNVNRVVSAGTGSGSGMVLPSLEVALTYLDGCFTINSSLIFAEPALGPIVIKVLQLHYVASPGLKCLFLDALVDAALLPGCCSNSLERKKQIYGHNLLNQISLLTDFCFPSKAEVP